MVLDKFYRNNPQYLYTLLVDAGAYAEALTLIRRDAKHPVQAGFWHGVLLWRTGQRAEAERQWRKVLQIEKDATAMPSRIDLLELTLTHYYLGDKDGSGLGRVLNATREQGAFWGWFFLAGLGWASAETWWPHVQISIWPCCAAGVAWKGASWRAIGGSSAPTFWMRPNRHK